MQMIIVVEEDHQKKREEEGLKVIDLSIKLHYGLKSSIL